MGHNTPKKTTDSIQTAMETIDFFKLAFENSATGKSITSPDGTIKVNKAFSEMMGYTPDEMSHLKWQDITHPDDLENSNILFKNLLNGKDVSGKFEKRYFHKNGQLVWATGNTYLQRNSKGDPLFFITDIFDISERKQIEQALKESELKYRELVENSPDAIAIYVDGKIALVNKECLHLMAASRTEELIRKSVLQFVHPDYRSIVMERMKKAVNEGSVLPLTEEKFIRLDGSEVDVEVKSMFTLLDNKPAVQLIIRDITERKQTEEALRKSKLQYDNLVSKIPVGVYILHSKSDGTFALDYVSPRMAEMLSLSVESLLADANLVIQSIHPDDRNSFATMNLEGIHLQRPFDWKGRVLVEGKEKWLHIRSTPELLEDGNILWHGLIVDITEHKNADLKIQLINEELSKAIAEKDKFFSIIAHDLRSPFNALLGFTQLLDEGVQTMSIDKIQEIASILKSSATNVYGLLENLLEWSRIQREITGFVPKSFILLPKISESLQSVLEPANKKGIDISINVPEDLQVFADANMLESTIRNLASNAVKFTPKGGKITITAKSAENNLVEISITDTGIGMSKALLDILFCLDKHSNRKGTDGEPSTGLGLIICKDFVEKHGGKIWAESEVGKGSTFYFTIPSE